MSAKRKYPVGIQSFESLRKDGYLYIDKTPLIYMMITEGKPYFLSRPRRFGKSLLVSTLAAVFEGRRDLFEAFTTEQGIKQPQLFIATTDWKWEKYPVLRFDFSAGDLSTVEQLDTLIDFTLGTYEKQYGITPPAKDANVRMVNLMRTLHEKTGKRVVVLVDEYDNFILHSLGDKERVKLARQRFQNVFGPLKAEDDHLQFAFITGISKFSQMGIFSKLNNLANISMVPMFETLCGISEQEMTMQLHPDIKLLGEANGLDYSEQFAVLKRMYDGYHFSERQTVMYNPFSLVYAFQMQQVGSYWFDRGTSSALFEMLAQMPRLDMAALEGRNCSASAFDLPLDGFDDPLPVLYQSGYLTIKEYDREFEDYTLGFPNQEVRRGFAECLYRHVVAVGGSDENKGELFQAYKRFSRSASLDDFIEAVKIFFEGIPYQWAQDNRNEHYYHALLYTLLVAFGADVRAEEPTAKGRADITLKMPKGIYVMELKYDKPVQEALDQINQKGYAEKYRLDGRPITKVGIAFSSKERNITDWQAVPL
ncbi:MAG: ATP-binding protein [Prevotella sp.]|nr:ATP-binding protein [Prevotella sp.]